MTKKSITETEEELNSITLKKDSKGSYNWEIKIYGNDIDKILELIYKANNELEKKYKEV